MLSKNRIFHKRNPWLSALFQADTGFYLKRGWCRLGPLACTDRCSNAGRAPFEIFWFTASDTILRKKHLPLDFTQTDLMLSKISALCRDVDNINLLWTFVITHQKGGWKTYLALHLLRAYGLRLTFVLLGNITTIKFYHLGISITHLFRFSLSKKRVCFVCFTNSFVKTVLFWSHFFSSSWSRARDLLAPTTP